MAPNVRAREISPKRRRTPPRRHFDRRPPFRNSKHTCNKKERESYSSRRFREMKERKRYKRKTDYGTGSKDNGRELYTKDKKSDRKCSNDSSPHREKRRRRNSFTSNCRSERRDGNGRCRDRDNIKVDFTRKRSGSCEKNSSSSYSSTERNFTMIRDMNPRPKEFYGNQNPVISLPVRAPMVPVVRRILLPPMPPRPLIRPHILPRPCLRIPCPPRALRPIIRPVIKVVAPFASVRHPVMPLGLPVVSPGPQLNFTLPSVQYVIE